MLSPMVGQLLNKRSYMVDRVLFTLVVQVCTFSISAFKTSQSCDQALTAFTKIAATASAVLLLALRDSMVRDFVGNDLTQSERARRSD